MNDINTRGLLNHFYISYFSLYIFKFDYSNIFIFQIWGKDVEQSSVYYSSHSSMHHQYYQQTHHQMMSSSHHHHHHQQSVPTGYEIMLPPPQHSMWPTDYESDRSNQAHHGQSDDMLARIHAFAWSYGFFFHLDSSHIAIKNGNRMDGNL